MILLIDNYDSFVYNLARYVGLLQCERVVKRNDQITLEEIKELAPSHIIISPGPKAPDTAGISMSVIQTFGQTIPILGVCLGHQAIGAVFGAKIQRAKRPLHGKSCLISHEQKTLFAELPNPLRVARYHSLIVSQETFPEVLRVTATSPQGEVMALEHIEFPVFGVQFHPESVLTEAGLQLLKNFIGFVMPAKAGIQQG